MAFTPENELEQAMQLAVTDRQARPAFYRLLLDSELSTIGEMSADRGGISLETVAIEGQRFHPLFTARSRLDTFLAESGAPEPQPRLGIPGRILFLSTRGAQFVVNPGFEVGKIVSADEVSWMLENFQPQLVVAQPKVYPAKLVKALCVLFTSRALIKAAHLVYVAREGIDAEGHPMIGLEADGEVERLAQEIFEAAEAVMPGTPVEVVYLDPKAPLDPLQKHLLGVAPFYKRAFAVY